MSNNTLQVFDSIIELTSARDRPSLDIALLKSLKYFIDDTSEAALLRVPRDMDSDYLETSWAFPLITRQQRFTFPAHKYGNQRVYKDELIKHCVDKISIVKVSSNRTLFPIYSRTLVTGVLDIDNNLFTDELIEEIQHLLHIYSDILDILFESEHDTLTGLRNRKTFDFHLSNLLESSLKSVVSTHPDDKRHTLNVEECHWIGILDIDFFKLVNDNFGHIYGDEVLLLFSKIMIKSFRNSDVMFRYGGEEFVVVLSPTDKENALIVFERFRSTIEQYDFPKVGKITVSIGVSSLGPKENPAIVLENADKALYYAKENGRNQVLDYQTLLVKGLVKEPIIDNDIVLF